MKNRLYISRWMLLIVGVLAVACGHDDLVMPDEPEKEPPYVELRIAVPYVSSLTRGNPLGGEEGNGRENGILHEDDIHDINVFFYIENIDPVSGEGLGMDSSDDTEIIKHIYYNIDNSSDTDNTPLVTVTKDEGQNTSQSISNGFLTLKFGISQAEMDRANASGINFVAIANAGPIQYTQGMKMKSLRGMKLDYHTSASWTTKLDAMSKNASKMDYFLMSTAYNNEPSFGTNKVTPSGDNYVGTTTLQRLYARLDLWYNMADNAVIEVAENGEKKVSELRYAVEGAVGNLVYVTNVLPVNIMRDPSFLFKKVTNDNTGWLADNSIWNKSSLDGVMNFSWGGKESPNDLPVASPDLPKNYVMEWHTKSKQPYGASPNDSLYAWYGSSMTEKVKSNILRTNQNSDTDGHFSTYYHEEKQKGAYDPDYKCDHISIISYANENTHPTDCFHSNYLTGMSFRAVYVPAKIYSAYLATNQGGNSVKSPVEWVATDRKPTSIFRYSPSAVGVDESKSLYFTNNEAARAYANDHPADMAVITEFPAQLHDGKWGCECYYNLWLRHYNNEAADPQLSYPMEYATVRNNIYRVKVSFTGPGDPTPTMREPDTMKARIFVRKWNMREEKNPLDF